MLTRKLIAAGILGGVLVAGAAAAPAALADDKPKCKVVNNKIVCTVKTKGGGSGGSGGSGGGSKGTPTKVGGGLEAGSGGANGLGVGSGLGSGLGWAALAAGAVGAAGIAVAGAGAVVLRRPASRRTHG